MAAVLDFMADHPGQAFALTDLVRALKLSRATCHALLTGLVQVGYLYRTSDKTYVLGPALAVIGRVAAEHFSPLQVAQPEMRRLADEYDVVCSAFFLEGDTICSRERAASVSHVGYSIPVGTRVKLRPRGLSTFFAWSPAEAKARLEAFKPPVTAEQRATFEGSMAFAREHGFNVHIRRRQAGHVPVEPAFDVEDADFPVSLASELTPNAHYGLSSVTAPVFDGDGKVAFVMGLMGFHGEMTGAEIIEVGKTLKAACDRITSFIAGKRRRRASA